MCIYISFCISGSIRARNISGCRVILRTVEWSCKLEPSIIKQRHKLFDDDVDENTLDLLDGKSSERAIKEKDGASRRNNNYSTTLYTEAPPQSASKVNSKQIDSRLALCARAI